MVIVELGYPFLCFPVIKRGSDIYSNMKDLLQNFSHHTTILGVGKGGRDNIGQIASRVLVRISKHIKRFSIKKKKGKKKTENKKEN